MKGISSNQGEIFASKLMIEILEADTSHSIEFFTNGMLLTRKNMEFLTNKYNDIYMKISIDSTDKERLEYLRRGANYETIMTNLQYAGELRKLGKIGKLTISCVLQRDNFNEMNDFIKLGRSVNADIIRFSRLQNWGMFTDDEYIQLDVHNPENQYYQEFVTIVATNPALLDEDVYVIGLEHLLEAYRKFQIAEKYE